MEKIKGKVYILGDDINTDDIVPSHTLTMRDPKEMAQCTLEFIDPEFAKNVHKHYMETFNRMEDFTTDYRDRHSSVVLMEKRFNGKIFFIVFFKRLV